MPFYKGPSEFISKLKTATTTKGAKTFTTNEYIEKISQHLRSYERASKGHDLQSITIK